MPVPGVEWALECGLGAVDAGTALQSCCVLLGSIRPSRGETVGARRRRTTTGGEDPHRRQKHRKVLPAVACSVSWVCI